jgi:hypothetical protein
MQHFFFNILEKQIEEENNNSRKRIAPESVEEELHGQPKKMRMEQLDLWSCLDEAFDDAVKEPSTNNGNSDEDEGCFLSQSVSQESTGIFYSIENSFS